MTDNHQLQNGKFDENRNNLVQSNSEPSQQQLYRMVLPDICIGFRSKEGKLIFKEALTTDYMECYFGLATQFITQDKPTFCALSSLVIALNTLEVDPKRLWNGEWRWYHEYMLESCVPLEVIEAKGVILEEMRSIAACNCLNVSLVYAKQPNTEEKFRNTIKHVVQTIDEVLIVSFSRSGLQQSGNAGHCSPIAGYHPERDLVLILDTARYKYPPFWVSVPLLWKAMTEIDMESGQPRGYMVVSRSQDSP